MSKTISTLLFVMLCSYRAFGFSAGGHRVIAEIAWQHLDEKTRAECVELLKYHPRFEEDFVKRMPDRVRAGDQAVKDHWLFLNAAVWADLPRGFKSNERKKYHRGPWHYVNIPTFLNPEDEQAIDLSSVNRSMEFEGPFRDDPSLNICQAIKANLSGLKDQSRTKAERAIHLCWVMHLVGDSHQPMHATALFEPNVFPKGCRGGNLIKVGRSNLHSTWDGLLGRDTAVGSIQGRAVKYVQEFGGNRDRPAKTLSPETWLKESQQIAQNVAYDADVRAAIKAADDEVRVTLSVEYRQRAGHHARRRAVEAGYRLAASLQFE